MLNDLSFEFYTLFRAARKGRPKWYKDTKRYLLDYTIMKYRYLLIGLLSTLALSCTMEEIYSPDGTEVNPASKSRVFYVSIDEQPDMDTKVYADENLRVLWNKDDRISIFNTNTFNQEYTFQGEDGDNSGEIDPMGAAGEGEDLDNNMVYAIYPYQESTSISTSGVISFDMPAVQYYKENTFGLEANTMLSVTEPDEILKFKNVGGYLALKMYGNAAGVQVSSIILRGNNNEPLAGPSTIVMTEDGPSVSIASATASKQIRFYYETPVELGTSNDTNDCTVFWIVVPPIDFTGGFNVTVCTPDGQTYTQSTTKQFTINRSTVTRLAPFKVTPTGSINASLTKVTSTRKIAKSNGGEQDKTYEASYDSNTRTFTIMLPTVTDLSNNVTFNYTYNGSGVKLLANGKEVMSGDPIKAKGLETSLLVCKGDAEKRYTLKVTNTGLPVVRITTEGFTRERIEGDADHDKWYGVDPKKPENTIGQAYIRIDMPDGSPGMKVRLKDDTEVPVYEVETQIRGRGNASWTYKKRPYALKLPEKAEVLGMNYHKRWALLANWKDRTLLRNDAAFWLSRQTVIPESEYSNEVPKSSGLPYTVSGQFVELEFNGVHRGNYYLCEQIKIDKNRVNIKEFDATKDITGGYLLEIDNNYDEPYRFLSGFYGKTNNSGQITDTSGMKYMFKDEPDDGFPTNAVEYVVNYIKDMEALIKAIPNNLSSYQANADDENYGYRGYLDMDSAIWFMFVQELTGNGDFFNTDSSDPTSKWYGPHSTYLYKDRKNKSGVESKLFMGPVWDFDYHTFIYERTRTKWNGQVVVLESRWNKWVGADQQNYYYYYMCKDPVFRSRMESLWEKYYGKVTSQAFSDYINGMADYISQSEAFNTEMWGWTQTTSAGQDQDQNGDNTLEFQEAVAEMIRAYSAKLGWMNTNLPNLNK